LQVDEQKVQFIGCGNGTAHFVEQKYSLPTTDTTKAHVM